MIRVLVVDPDPWRHRGLCAVLQDAGAFQVSPETDYGRILTLTTRPDELNVDVVSVAHRLVLEYGLSVVALMRDVFEPAPVIVHGEFDSVEITAQVYAAGARGYFVLSHPPGLYAKAVQLVSQGKYWGSREAVALMAENVIASQQAPKPDDRLNDEERQLLALLNEGLSNKEIGQRLSLAEPTIKSRFNKLYRKFGVATRLQLLTAAIRDGLVRGE